LLADGVALAVLLGSTAAYSSRGMLLGTIGLTWATPIVHAVHGRPRFMWASLGIRSAAGLFAVMISCSQSSFGTPNSDGHPYGTQTTCGNLEALPIAFGLGATAAAMVDSALFAWQEPAAAPGAALDSKTTESKQYQVKLDGAGVLPLSSGAGVTLAGRF
jgi:hypothetical protein